VVAVKVLVGVRSVAVLVKVAVGVSVGRCWSACR
jgi:hypothetical protein